MSVLAGHGSLSPAVVRLNVQFLEADQRQLMALIAEALSGEMPRVLTRGRADGPR